MLTCWNLKSKMKLRMYELLNLRLTKSPRAPCTTSVWGLVTCTPHLDSATNSIFHKILNIRWLRNNCSPTIPTMKPILSDTSIAVVLYPITSVSIFNSWRLRKLTPKTLTLCDCSYFSFECLWTSPDFFLQKWSTFRRKSPTCHPEISGNSGTRWCPKQR